MNRRNFLLGVAGASAALVGADQTRLAATAPTDQTRAITGELLIAGFSAATPNLLRLGGWRSKFVPARSAGSSSLRTMSATRMTSWGWSGFFPPGRREK